MRIIFQIDETVVKEVDWPTPPRTDEYVSFDGVVYRVDALNWYPDKEDILCVSVEVKRHATMEQINAGKQAVTS